MDIKQVIDFIKSCDSTGQMRQMDRAVKQRMSRLLNNNLLRLKLECQRNNRNMVQLTDRLRVLEVMGPIATTDEVPMPEEQLQSRAETSRAVVVSTTVAADATDDVQRPSSSLGPDARVDQLLRIILARLEEGDFMMSCCREHQSEPSMPTSTTDTDDNDGPCDSTSSNNYDMQDSTMHSV